MDLKVILVDDKDKEIGLEEKLKAHQNGGHLHRAISVFVFNSKRQLLLQQRANSKYHAGNQWANTVCSHPFPDETVEAAAHRRLKEEMGFDCDMKEKFTFTYKAEVGNGLTEHEFDHVFYGTYEGEPKPDPSEVSDWKWVGLPDLKADIVANPQKYAPWLRLMIDRIK